MSVICAGILTRDHSSGSVVAADSGSISSHLHGNDLRKEEIKNRSTHREVQAMCANRELNPGLSRCQREMLTTYRNVFYMSKKSNEVAL